MARIIYNSVRSHTYRARSFELIETPEIDNSLKESRANINFDQSAKLRIHDENRIFLIAIDRADILCKERFYRGDHKSPGSF